MSKRTVVKAVVRRTSGIRDEWLAQDHVTADLRERLREAHVVLGPTRLSPDGIRYFPEHTLQLYREIRAAAPDTVVIDLLQEDERYAEWAEHDAVATIANLLVTALVLPTVATLLAEYIKNRYTSGGKNPTGQSVRMKVYADDRWLDYEGPAEKAPEVLLAFAAMGPINDVTHLLEPVGNDDVDPS